MGRAAQQTGVVVIAALLSLLATGCDATGIIAGASTGASGICSGHGDEDLAGGEPRCACFDGYAGDDCSQCTFGYQDNDNDGTCSPDCTTGGAALGCSPQQVCSDASGVIRCECKPGYEGDSCTDCTGTYQDNDGDLNCEPSCADQASTCGAHGTCDDTSGHVSCSCEFSYSGANCDQCSEGYQDNDNDGTCAAGCEVAGTSCGVGSCDDSSGTVQCECAEGHTGADCSECAAGYQDNDRDGECRPSCATAGYSCSGNGRCDDSSGTAACDCDSGYVPDGAGNCVGQARSYIVTYVNDDLDPSDGDLMRSGLRNLGYTEEDFDSNVSSRELASYLETPVTLLYHTGHGLEGGVSTSDGLFETYDASIAAENTIFATCLTLDDSGWPSTFQSSAETLMGYTKVSYDGPDDDVVDSYLSALGNGRSHLQAWYLSNASVSSLSDRWAAYSRYNGSIVEFSARTGNTPSTRVGSALVPAGAGSNVRVSEQILSDGSDYSQLFPPVAIMRGQRLITEVAAGDLTDWLQPTAMTADQAGELARDYLLAQGLLPADALTVAIIPIEARAADPRASLGTVGFTVRFGRYLNGLPVRGMGVGHHVAALVADGQVVSVTSYWPELASTSAASLARAPLLTLGEATTRAAGEISLRIKSFHASVDIVQAYPVYGSTSPTSGATELVPAYELVASDGSRFVVDATTGRLLR